MWSHDFGPPWLYIWLIEDIKSSNFQWVEITFLKENKANPSINPCDDNRSSVWALVWWLEYVSIVWWLYTPVFIYRR